MTHKKIDDATIFTYNIRDRRTRSEDEKKRDRREAWITIGILLALVATYYTFV